MMDQREAMEMLTSSLRNNGYQKVEDVAQQLQLTMLREWIAHLCTVLNEETELTRTGKMRVIRAMIYGAVPRDAEVQMRRHLADLRIQDVTRYGFDAGTGLAPQAGRA